MKDSGNTFWGLELCRWRQDSSIGIFCRFSPHIKSENGQRRQQKYHQRVEYFQWSLCL